MGIRASASQAEGRGFETRFPLHLNTHIPPLDLFLKYLEGGGVVVLNLDVFPMEDYRPYTVIKNPAALLAVGSRPNVLERRLFQDRK